MPDDPGILTLGHSNHSIERFVELLLQCEATMVVDVRSVPYSRFHPQFNRENLFRALAEKGIAYLFLGKELGARTEDQNCYDNGRVQYRRLAATESFRSGLDRVRAEAGKHRIALMCAEREPLECHRTILIGRELASTGTPVAHIHADGRLESHAGAMRRLLKLLGLTEQDLFRSQSEQIDGACRKQEERIAYRQRRT